jgi:hypothetical protein
MSVHSHPSRVVPLQCVQKAVDKGSVVIMQSGECIATELGAVAYQAEGIKRITHDGAVTRLGSGMLQVGRVDWEATR